MNPKVQQTKSEKEIRIGKVKNILDNEYKLFNEYLTNGYEEKECWGKIISETLKRIGEIKHDYPHYINSGDNGYIVNYLNALE